MIAAMAFVGAVIYCLNSLGNRSPLETVPPDREHDSTDLTLDVSLLSQQLDELFKHFVQRISAAETLTLEDRTMLESWLEFDERFLERIPSRDTLKYERVTAHLRLGRGLYLLKMTNPSIDHIQHAIDLLDELIAENPVVASYRKNQADAYYTLGRSLRLVGRNGAALQAFEASLNILSDPDYPPTDDRQELMIDLYHQKRELLAPNINVE